MTRGEFARIFHLLTAFKVCDEVLAGSVKGIAELVTKAVSGKR